MALEGVLVNPGTATGAVAVLTDFITAATGYLQVFKIDLGGDGLSSPLVRGQLSATQSIPVVLASDQSAVAVSGTVGISGTVPISATGVAVSGSVSISGTAAVSATGIAVTSVAGTVAISATGVAVSGSVTADTELPAAAALSDALANPTAPAVGAHNLLWSTATSLWVRWPGTTTLGGLVNITNATLAVLAKQSSATGLLAVVQVFATDGATPINAGDSTNNALRVNIIAGAGSGGTAMADGATFSIGSTSFTPAGAIVPLGTEAPLATQQAGVLGMTSKRALLTTLKTVTGLDMTTASSVGYLNVLVGGPITVSATMVLTVTGSVTADTELPAAAALADSTANPTAPAVGAFSMLWSTATGGAWYRMTGATTGMLYVQGNIAHDAADIPGQPLKIGGYARATASNVLPVSHGDRVLAAFDKVGSLIVQLGAIPEDWVVGKTSTVTSTSITSVVSGPTATDQRLHITRLKVINSITSVGTWVNILDGTSAIDTGFAAAGGGGWTESIWPPLRLTASQALQMQNETVNAEVRVIASGYKGY